MRRIILLCAALMLITIGPAAADETMPTVETVRYYFHQGENGSLRLETLPPSSQSNTPWTVSGVYDPYQGVDLRIPFTNPEPGLAVDEDAGLQGILDLRLEFDGDGIIVWLPASDLTWSLVTGNRSTTF